MNFPLGTYTTIECPSDDVTKNFTFQRFEYYIVEHDEKTHTPNLVAIGS